MSVQTIADIISDIRTEVDDAPDSNLSVDEALGGKQDGVNKRFQSSHEHVVTSIAPELRINDVLQTLVIVPPVGPQYNLDANKGIWTVGTAPADINVRVLSTYYWNWFADSTYNAFIVGAGEFVGYAPTVQGDAATRAVEVITKIPEGLLPALKAFVEHLQWRRRSAEWARRYSSSTSGQSTGGADQVAPKFEEMAKARLAAATAMRDDYYKGFSKREFPVSVQTGTSGVGPYAPRR